jgi:two-component system response regulator MprA
MTKKLLVIDDEKSITTIIDKIASGLGYRVKTSNDPATALADLAVFQPDILMLDIVMPNLDGIDILRQVLAAGVAIRIIIMTGFGSSFLRLGQAIADFHDHPPVAKLAKPFRRVDVVALLTAEQHDHPEANTKAAFVTSDETSLLGGSLIGDCAAA